MMTTKAEDEKKKEPRTKELLLVYRGVKVNRDDKLFHEYQRVDKQERDGDSICELVGDTLWYSKKLHHGSPGTMITILQNIDAEGCQLFSSSVKNVGLWPHNDQRVAWTALSRATENAHEESKAMDKLMTGNAALDRLAPFREAYHRAPAKVRRQILAEVIRAITS